MKPGKARFLEHLLDQKQPLSIAERMELLIQVREGCTPQESREIDAALVEQNHRLAVALEKAQDRENTRKQQHHVCAVVVEPATGDSRVKVSLHGNERVVTLDPDLTESLDVGTAVLLNADATLAVSRTTLPRESTGDVGSFEAHLENGEILVKSGSADYSLRLVNGVKADRLQKGDLIIFDRLHKHAHSKIEECRAAALPFELVDVDHLSATDVGGLDRQLKQLIDTLKLGLLYSEQAARYRLNGFVGILLTGPPGNGKTLLARIAAAELGRVGSEPPARFVSVKPGEFETEWLGMTQRRIRETFAAIRDLASDGGYVILCLDEVETFSRVRGRNLVTTAHDDFSNALLVELDGMRSLSNVALIAATNRPDLLDPAFRSRIASISLEVSAPGITAAREILGIHLRKDDPWEATDSCSESIETALSLIFSPNSVPARISRVRFSDGSSRIVSASELVSGRMLQQIATSARREAALREIAGGPAGITPADVAAATEAAVQGLRITLTKHNLADYIGGKLPQDLGIVAVEPIAS